LIQVNDQEHHESKEETVTRLEKSRATSAWMQAVLASDSDLFAEVLRRGLEALMEAERDAYVGAAPFERGEHRPQAA
jgi:hypothetical protein